MSIVRHTRCSTGTGNSRARRIRSRCPDHLLARDGMCVPIVVRRLNQLIDPEALVAFLAQP